MADKKISVFSNEYGNHWVGCSICIVILCWVPRSQWKIAELQSIPRVDQITDKKSSLVSGDLLSRFFQESQHVFDYN